jgi:hypothetical protein
MAGLELKLTLGNAVMSVTQSEADRIRRQYAALTSHYRAIGPAAILAAVLAANNKPKPLRKAA